MKDPITVLMEEHRVIESVLDALEVAAERDVSLSFYERAVDFIVNFADGCHHAKEEERLFPVLEQCGIPREGGPIGVMCHEHVAARELVRMMRDAIVSNDIAALHSLTRDYASLLRAHIHKEDQVLFPMGRTRLAREDIESVAARFREVDDDGETRRKYTALAEELRAEAGL